MNSRKPSGFPVDKWWYSLPVDKHPTYPQLIPSNATRYNDDVYSSMHRHKALPLLGCIELSTENPHHNSYINNK